MTGKTPIPSGLIVFRIITLPIAIPFLFLMWIADILMTDSDDAGRGGFGEWIYGYVYDE